MLNEDELKEIDVLDWKILAKSFTEAALLLGNGFSRSITGDRFRYDSLFEKFLTKCSPKNKRIFKEFGTSNFEFILEKLVHAVFVNRVFNIDPPRIREIEEASQCLKDGLINTIHDIHPLAGDIDKEILERIGYQLNRFNDIFTLNYDLFLYRIIMILNEKHRQGESVGQYSDFFWDNYDEQFLCFDTSEEFEGYKHPYYLHGALFLFKEASYDLKLKKREHDSPTELVKLVGDAIQEDRMPLFVSEGTPQDKMETIAQSYYLKFALKKLEEAECNLVIFGTSLSDPDQHVVDAINKNDRDLAVSIHIGTKSKEQVKSERDRIKQKFEDYHTVKFFDSETLFKF